MSHLPQVNGVQNFPNNFNLDTTTLTFDFCDLDPDELDLRPLTLTYDLDPLDIDPWTTFSDTRLKTGIFTFLTLVTLTFDLDLHTHPRYDGPKCVCQIQGP